MSGRTQSDVLTVVFIRAARLRKAADELLNKSVVKVSPADLNVRLLVIPPTVVCTAAVFVVCTVKMNKNNMTLYNSVSSEQYGRGS